LLEQRGNERTKADAATESLQGPHFLRRMGAVGRADDVRC
jgi:hypothetical protein